MPSSDLRSSRIKPYYKTRIFERVVLYELHSEPPPDHYLEHVTSNIPNAFSDNFSPHFKAITPTQTTTTTTKNHNGSHSSTTIRRILLAWSFPPLQGTGPKRPTSLDQHHESERTIDEDFLTRTVPYFAFPSDEDGDDVTGCRGLAGYSYAFALTDEPGYLLFGFCRRRSDRCLVVLTYRPWWEPFRSLGTLITAHLFNLPNSEAHHNDRQITNPDLLRFLTNIHERPLYGVEEDDSDHVIITVDPGPVVIEQFPGARLVTLRASLVFRYKRPELLENAFSDGVPAIIPTNRIFTELYNSLTQPNILILWTALLYESRVLLISRKLNRLSTASFSILYLLFPLHWQHIFIPILPRAMLDAVSAPIPYLIGLPKHLFELTEFSTAFHDRHGYDPSPDDRIGSDNAVIIVDLDEDRIAFYRQPATQSRDDGADTVASSNHTTLPNFVSSNLGKRLAPKYPAKPTAAVQTDGDFKIPSSHSPLPGSIYIGEAFLLAMVDLIGDYRNGLVFEPGAEITFDSESFLKACRPSARLCLESILKTQMFEQFISERLHLLNSGHGFDDVFEREVNIGESESNKLSQVQKYRDWLSYMKNEGDFYLRTFKNKTAASSITLLKNVPQIDWAYFNLKLKGKSAFNMVRQMRPFSNSPPQLGRKMYEPKLEKGTEFYCDSYATPGDLGNTINGDTATPHHHHPSTHPNTIDRSSTTAKLLADSKSLPWSYNWKSCQEHDPDLNNNLVEGSRFLASSPGVQPNAYYHDRGHFGDASYRKSASTKSMVLIRQNSTKQTSNAGDTLPSVAHRCDTKLPPELQQQTFKAVSPEGGELGRSMVVNDLLPKPPSPRYKSHRRRTHHNGNVFGGGGTESLIDLDSVPNGPDLEKIAADRLLEEFCCSLDFNSHPNGHTNGHVTDDPYPLASVDFDLPIPNAAPITALNGHSIPHTLHGINGFTKSADRVHLLFADKNGLSQRTGPAVVGQRITTTVQIDYNQPPPLLVYGITGTSAGPGITDRFNKDVAQPNRSSLTHWETFD